MNDQWNSNGNCNLCRRQKYCSKPCKACKRAEAIRLHKIACDIMAIGAAKVIEDKIKGEEKDEI